MKKVTAAELEEIAGGLRDNGEGLKAIKFYRKAADTYLGDGNKQKSAECWHMIGVSYKVENDIDEAVKTLLKAIELYKEAGDKVGVGRVYRDIGIAYAYRKQHDKAIGWLEKSVDTLEGSGADAELGISEAKIGLHYIEVKDYDKAEKWILRGLATIRSASQWFYEMTTLLHLAALRYFQKRYSDAIAELLSAEKLIIQAGKQDNQKRRLAQIYGLLAQCYLSIKNIDKAVDFFAKAMQLLEPMADNVAQRVYDDIHAFSFLSKLKDQYPDATEQLEKQFDLSKLDIKNSEYR